MARKHQYFEKTILRKKKKFNRDIREALAKRKLSQRDLCRFINQNESMFSIYMNRGEMNQMQKAFVLAAIAQYPENHGGEVRPITPEQMAEILSAMGIRKNE